jgi:exodeoxyribonuclease-1
VGYNTIRFDDEVTRFLFWRNLIDPYAREWQNDSGRWDLLDVVRLTYALRPDGIEWPKKEDGKPSFKLEDLARANGLLHESAHDALSDVRATIALARLIATRQPKLFDFAFGLHKKDRVARSSACPQRETAKPFLHVSGMFPVERGCIAVMWPLASHPTNKNELLAWDLAQDPSSCATWTPTPAPAPVHPQRRPARRRGAAAGQERSPEQVAHGGRQPAHARAGHGRALGHRHRRRPCATPNCARPARHERHLAAGVCAPQGGRPDVDEDLYGGFVGNGDRRRLNQLRALSPEELAKDRTGFDDGRLDEILFRYRARNWPELLNEEETERWEALARGAALQGRGRGAHHRDAVQRGRCAFGECRRARRGDPRGALRVRRGHRARGLKTTPCLNLRPET